jgi:two-component system CAI-1 autoinducer sensor kinase/phosphatase CqsS
LIYFINIWLDSNKKCLYFKDNGVGIVVDKLVSIFDDFITANKESGAGLGLPFCKRVMISFCGDILYKYFEGGGGLNFVYSFQKISNLNKIL